MPVTVNATSRTGYDIETLPREPRPNRGQQLLPDLCSQHRLGPASQLSQFGSLVVRRPGGPGNLGEEGQAEVDLDAC